MAFFTSAIKKKITVIYRLSVCIYYDSKRGNLLNYNLIQTLSTPWILCVMHAKRMHLKWPRYGWSNLNVFTVCSCIPSVCIWYYSAVCGFECCETKVCENTRFLFWWGDNSWRFRRKIRVSLL